MMVDFELMIYCLLAGAVYLLIIDLIWNWLERIVPLFDNFPKELLEEKGLFWFFSCYIVELIFFVMMPSIIYGWFYAVLPFSGVRGGIAVALFALIFGMIPLAVLISFRIKIPVLYLLYQLTGLLFKVVGAMIIIGYLYSL